MMSDDWTVLGDPPEKRPPLPRPYPKGGWSPTAKAEWKEWWSSPVASKWIDTDVSNAELLLRMIHNWDSPTVTQAREIRLWKSGLGLTPRGRRYLGWLLPDEAPSAPVVPIEEAPSVRRRRTAEPT